MFHTFHTQWKEETTQAWERKQQNTLNIWTLNWPDTVTPYDLAEKHWNNIPTVIKAWKTPLSEWCRGLPPAGNTPLPTRKLSLTRNAPHFLLVGDCALIWLQRRQLFCASEAVKVHMEVVWGGHEAEPLCIITQLVINKFKVKMDKIKTCVCSYKI